MLGSSAIPVNASFNPTEAEMVLLSCAMLEGGSRAFCLQNDSHGLQAVLGRAGPWVQKLFSGGNLHYPTKLSKGLSRGAPVSDLSANHISPCPTVE